MNKTILKKQKMTNKQKGIGLVILLILLAVVAYSAKYWNAKHQGSSNDSAKTGIGLKKDAPTGKLAAEFPKELVLDSKATVDASYTIPYQNNINQATGAFLSSKSITDAYNMYLDYMEKNGYQVRNKNLTDAVASIYASKDDADVNVVITTDFKSKSTSIVITYLKK